MPVQLGSAYGKIIIDGSGARAGADEAEGALNRFQRSARSILEFATGQLVARGFQAIGSGLAGTARQAINSASTLQDLTLALETLTAREAVAAGEAETIEEALSGVGPVAEDLKQRLEDLSIVSPFEYEDVASTFRVQMAFGATSDAAMDLTGAIMDTGAALGLAGQDLERMNYNLAQALIQGDLTGANLRQLKGVGLDLAGVLEGRLGRSLEQIRDDLESGALTMEEVSQAFIDYTDENFGGASERMSRTFTGLKSSINDLFFFAGADLLTPTLDRVTEVLGGVFDQARAMLDSGIFERIGEQLADGVDRFFAFAGRAIDALRGLYRAFQSGGLSGVIESIDWRGIGQRALELLGSGFRAAASMAAEILAPLRDGVIRFITETDWSGVGRRALNRIGNGFQVAIAWAGERLAPVRDAIVRFFTETDWLGLGRSILNWIGDGLRAAGSWAWDRLVSVWGAISGFFEEQDWRAIGQSVLDRIGNGLQVTREWASERLLTAKESIVSFFTETDWLQVGRDILARIGEGIRGAVSNIDIGGAFEQAMGFLSGGGGKGVGVAAKLATTFGLLPGPIGTAVGALRLFAQAWTSDFAGIQEKIPAAFGAIRDTAGRVWSWIQGTAIPTLREWYGVFQTEIVPVIRELATTWLSELRKNGQMVWSWIQDTAIPILQEWYDWFNTNIIPVFRELSEEVLTNLWDKLREVWDWISNDGASTLERFGEAMRQGPMAAVLRFATFVLRVLIAYWKRVWTWIVETAIPTIQRWGAAFRKGLQPFLERIMERLRDFYTDIRPRLQSALKSIRGLFDQLKDSFSRISEVWKESLKPALDRLAEALGINTDESDSFFESLGSLIGFILEAGVSDLIDSITRAVSALAIAADLAALAVEGITRSIEAVGKIVDGVVEGIDKLTGGFEDLTGVDLPDWLTPGSPTPFEEGIRGIGDAIRSLPNMRALLSGMLPPSFPAMAMAPAGAGASVDRRNQSRSMTIYGGLQAYGQSDPESFIRQLWEAAG